MRPARTGRGCTSPGRRPPPSPPPPGSRSGCPRRGRARPWPPRWPSARMGRGFRHRHPDPGQPGHQYATRGLQGATGQALAGRTTAAVTALSDASAIGVNPDGPRSSSPARARWSAETHRRSGTPPWLRRSHRSPALTLDAAGGLAEAVSLAVSPDGARVYVTGAGISPAGSATYATVAYDAATGAVLWDRRYVEGGTDAFAGSVVASPDGSRVYVTGEAGGTDGLDDTTVAHLAASGTQLWVAHHDLSERQSGPSAWRSARRHRAGPQPDGQRGPSGTAATATSPWPTAQRRAPTRARFYQAHAAAGCPHLWR